MMQASRLFLRAVGASLLLVAAIASYRYAPGISVVGLGIAALLLLVSFSDHLHLRKVIYVNLGMGSSADCARLKLAQVIRATSDNNDYLFSVRGMPVGVRELSSFISHSIGETQMSVPLSDEILYSVDQQHGAITLYKDYIFQGAPRREGVIARKLYDEWIDKGGIAVGSNPAVVLRKNRVALIGEVARGARFIAGVGVEDQSTIDSALRMCSGSTAALALEILTSNIRVISF